MSDIAIRVENLGKRYTIGVGQRHDTLRDALADFRLRIADFGRKSPKSRIENPKSEEFWALKDVSFEVHRGEVVGVIGRNGAGKSTLLKILSRITEPTTGYAEIHGRVGSLLEVGTGFHPELTGRENIYLNGAILGMKRTEIDRKFDEIVAFSEIEKFLDTPVKRYSSGMYVRLAFAVAAHLEPEILLVDEVLAVGDASFQKKCLGKMGDVAGEGRTVLFVSHNMGAVQSLCAYLFLFRDGRLCEQGHPESIIPNYLSDAIVSNDGFFDLSNHPSRPSKYNSIIQSVSLISSNGTQTASFLSEDSFCVKIDLNPVSPIKNPRIAIAIEDNTGKRILTLGSYFQENQIPYIIDSRCCVQCFLPHINLGSGKYLLSISISTQKTGLLDSIDNAAWFEIHWNNNYFGGEKYHTYYGPIIARSIWKVTGLE